MLNNCNHGIELEVIEPEQIEIKPNEAEWFESDESIEFKVSQNITDTMKYLKTSKGE